VSATPATEPLLRVAGLEVRYGGIAALRGISCDVRAGEIVTLIGSNGAGKSTLLRAISGLVRPSAGSIHFQGVDVTAHAPHVLVALGISHVPEGRRIFANLTVRENLQMGAYLRPETETDGLERVFGLFPRLRERLGQMGGTLSGGEQQMLAIARCLMMRPKLIILDEPTEGIMPRLVSQIRREIHRINRTGVSILLVEQNVETALKLCPRVFLMEKGTIVYSGAAQELKSQTEIVHRYLGLSR